MVNEEVNAMHKGSHRWIYIVAIVVVALINGATFFAGFGAGFGTGRLTAVQVAAVMSGPSPDDVRHGADLSSSPVLSTEGGAFSRARGEVQPPEFQVFWEAWQILKEEYYGKLPDNREMTYGAIQGVLKLLDDNHTSFLDPERAAFFNSGMSGSFEGIGARVEKAKGGGVRIVEPFQDWPAWKAGLRRGDIIVAVDGTDITQLDLTQAISRIRGPKGTTVTLTIVRKGVAKPFDVKVTRDRIEIPIVESHLLADGRVAYLRLAEFNGRSIRQVRSHLRQLMDHRPNGLILDLRGNPGGLLNAAVAVSGEFLPGGTTVLIERFRDGREQKYSADPGGLAIDIPLVVLVNEGSASASEIVAGAIQDTGRGILIGTTTYGKGSVQFPHTLSDGSQLRVTVARWFTPKGRQIQGTGLKPDIEVNMSQEDEDAGRDPQLDRAIQYLLSRTNQRSD
ncbi:MAG TPA: S41 family peptidase [Anaerolineae bacterium]|nr:S41 family peptidase [Anaerolineae bacterium]